MGVPLRGHRDDSRYQPDVGEPANHPGVGNFIELINFAVRQGNQTLGHHLKTCSSRETYISKTTQNLLLTCCYDMMRHLMHLTRNSCHFVLVMLMMMEISVKIL